MGVVTPIGVGISDFWQGLSSGRNGAGRVTAFDPSRLDTQIACEVKDFSTDSCLEPKEARRLDRFCHFAVAASKMALEQSGLKITDANRGRIGVLIGSGIGGTLTWEAQHSILLQRGPGRVSPFFIPMMISDMASGIVSIILGAQGPNFSITSACATSAHTIGEAAWMIARGDCDVMFAGGAEAAITELSLAGFCSMKAMSTRNDSPETASRPFDLERDGFVIGEGGGVLVLEAAEHAMARGAPILAELAGYGLSADAFHITAPDPDGYGASRSMQMALRNARLLPQDIGYINAHGTSTPLNDKLETVAIKTLFGDAAAKIPVTSTKSMHGHLLGAAGAVEAVAVILALQHQILPPTINLRTPDPECDLDYVPNQSRPHSFNAAISNSFGFGGHNATLVFTRWEG
jgi:3-oxoacyl-[acyl-carrier-protein] synthase II